MDNIRYLRKHRVVPLLNELVAEVVREKPNDPLGHLIATLTEIQMSVSEERLRVLERRRKEKAAAAALASAEADALAAAAGAAAAAASTAAPEQPAAATAPSTSTRGGVRLPVLDRGALLAAIASDHTPILSATAAVAAITASSKSTSPSAAAEESLGNEVGGEPLDNGPAAIAPSERSEEAQVEQPERQEEAWQEPLSDEQGWTLPQFVQLACADEEQGTAKLPHLAFLAGFSDAATNKVLGGTGVGHLAVDEPHGAMPSLKLLLNAAGTTGHPSLQLLRAARERDDSTGKGAASFVRAPPCALHLLLRGQQCPSEGTSALALVADAGDPAAATSRYPTLRSFFGLIADQEELRQLPNLALLAAVSASI